MAFVGLAESPPFTTTVPFGLRLWTNADKVGVGPDKSNCS